MGKVNQVELLEEKETLSKEELAAKIKRLQGYITRTENQIRKHEKALNKLREAMKKEIGKSMKSILRGNIYG